MPVTRAVESVPVAEIVRDFLVCLHQAGAQPSTIMNGIIDAFNSKDGILVTEDPSTEGVVDVDEMAHKVESDLVKTRNDMDNYARNSVG